MSGTILLIFLAVVFTVALAVVIVKYLPLKFRGLVNAFLLLIAFYLGYVIFESIMGPIRFNQEKKKRYARIITNLKMIRDAQEAYKKVFGMYQADHENLIKFIDTAKFAVTNTHNEIIEVNKGTKWQPIMVEIEKKVTDTTGYESVKETVFKNRNYQNMFELPGTNIKFKIELGFVSKLSGRRVPVFEVKVDKAIILKGLNIDLINQEKEAIGGDEIKGAFVSVGSLEEVNTNGNWPPFYDKKQK